MTIRSDDCALLPGSRKSPKVLLSGVLHMLLAVFKFCVTHAPVYLPRPVGSFCVTPPSEPQINMFINCIVTSFRSLQFSTSPNFSPSHTSIWVTSLLLWRSLSSAPLYRQLS